MKIEYKFKLDDVITFYITFLVHSPLLNDMRAVFDEGSGFYWITWDFQLSSDL